MTKQERERRKRIVRVISTPLFLFPFSLSFVHHRREEDRDCVREEGAWLHALLRGEWELGYHVTSPSREHPLCSPAPQRRIQNVGVTWILIGQQMGWGIHLIRRTWLAYFDGYWGDTQPLKPQPYKDSHENLHFSPVSPFSPLFSLFSVINQRSPTHST